MKVLGGRAPSSKQYDVTVTSWFEYDADTGVYTDQTGTTLPPSTLASGCLNALKEVVYNVYVWPQPPDLVSKKSYYKIEKVEADVVV